jgi:hypothetical protein
MPGVTSYNITYTDSAKVATTVNELVVAGQTSYSKEIDAVAAETYTVKVSALIAATESDATAATATATVIDKVTVPATVTVTPDADKAGTMTIDWADNAESQVVTKYTVTYANMFGTPVSVDVTNSKTAKVSTLTVSGLAADTYDVKVSATNTWGKSAESAPVTSAKLLAVSKPATPTLAVTTVNTELNVTWTANAASEGVTKYTVEYSSDAFATHTDVDAGTAATYKLTGLTANTTYGVRVVATNGTETITSDAATLKTPA